MLPLFHVETMGNEKKHSTDKKPMKGFSLDTLAQLGTNNKKALKKGVCGCCPEDDFKLNKGTSIKDKKSLQNRAKRKFLSTSLSLNLVDIAKSKRDNTQDFEKYNIEQRDIKSFWNMYHCSKHLEAINGRITGKYCKNRLCLVCNSIRTAVLMNRYDPIIESWGDDVYFVTLTIENVKGLLLKDSVKEMQSIIRRVQGRIKKQLQRSDSPKMQGLRKFECTYNPKRGDFHPHYHLMIKGKENARLFRKFWVWGVGQSDLINCKLIGKSRTGKRVFLQDIRKADKGATKELFKYFTKIISSTDDKKLIYCDSLHTIFQAIKGTRTFQSFGFKLPKEEKLKISDFDLSIEAPLEGGEQPEEKIEIETEFYQWQQPLADWVSRSTGELLSNYNLSKSMKELPKRMILTKNST